jgi:hypothetical protein
MNCGETDQTGKKHISLSGVRWVGALRRRHSRDRNIQHEGGSYGNTKQLTTTQIFSSISFILLKFD